MKKILFIVLITVLVTGILLGCSNTEQEVGKSIEQPQQETSGPELTAASEVIGYPDGATIQEFSYVKAGEPAAMVVAGCEAELDMANIPVLKIKEKTGVSLPIKLASEVTQDDKSNYNLVLIASPGSNALVEAVFDKLPKDLQITGTNPGKAKGIIGVVEGLFGAERDALIVAGSDEAGTAGSAANLAAIIAGEPWTTKMQFPKAELETLCFGGFTFDQRTDVRIAQELGYFPFYGIDCQIKGLASGTDVLTAITSGDVVGGSMADSIGLGGIAKGIKLKFVTSTQKEGIPQHIVVLKDSPIKSIEDLEGIKVASCWKPTVIWIAVNYELEQNNIESELIALDRSERVMTLLAGKVDAASWDSYSINEYQDKVRVIHTLESMKNLCSGYYFSEQFLDNNVELMERWAKGLTLGRRFIIGYPDEALKIEAERSGTPLEKLKQTEWPEYDEELLIRRYQMEFYQEVSVKYGILEQPLDLNEVIDTRFARVVREPEE